MQANISNKVKLGQSLDPLQDAAGVKAFDFSADIDNLLKKLDKLSMLCAKGQIDSDLLRYIPGMAKIMYQGQLIGSRQKRHMLPQLIQISKFWSSTLN